MLLCRDDGGDPPETLSDFVCRYVSSVLFNMLYNAITTDLGGRSASSLSNSSVPGDLRSSDTCSCASTFLNPPSLTPLRSIGGVTIVGRTV